MAKAAGKPAGTTTIPTVAVLHGPDRFTQLERTEAVKQAIATQHGAVEPVLFDGASAAPAVILDECRSLSLMQSFKLIIVDNADELLKAADDDEEGGGGGPASAGPGRRPGQRSAREVFEAYAANPERAACLILRAWTWRPGKIDKAILANDGWLHKCEEPSADEAFRWAIARAARHGTSIDEAAADRLVSAVGCDLGRIDCELAKLAVAVPGKPITERLVADLTVATREEEFWEIQPSLMSGDVERALLHLQDMLEISRHDPAPLTFTYMDLAKKLHGAARGLRAGESVPSLMSRLRLWGEAGNAVVAQAKKLDPVALARLMNHIVEYTLRVRTGQADAVRGLEAITIEFAGVCRK